MNRPLRLIVCLLTLALFATTACDDDASKSNAMTDAADTTTSTDMTTVNDMTSDVSEDVAKNDTTDDDTTVVDSGITSVLMVPTTGTILQWEALQLEAQVTADDGVDTSLVWSSSDEDIASVDENGHVTGHVDGVTEITATSALDATKSDSVIITVLATPIEVSTLEGEFRIRAKTDGAMLEEAGDGLLVGTGADAAVELQSLFVFEPQPTGTYRIRVKGTQKILHEDGNGDKLVSTRAQDLDRFTEFSLEPGDDGAFRVLCVGSGRYWQYDAVDFRVSTRTQPNDDSMQFFLDPVFTGSQTIRVQANRRYWNEDTDTQLIESFASVENIFIQFEFQPFAPGIYQILSVGSQLLLHADSNGGAVSTLFQPNDDHTRYRLFPQLDGTFVIRVVADNDLIAEDPVRRVLTKSSENESELTRFYIEAL